METHKEKKVIVLAVVVLAVIVLVIYFIKGGINNKPNYTFEKVNLATATTREEKLPPGMPKDIPVEITSARESYSADYPDLKYTLSTYSYYTTKSRLEMYNAYQSYMKSAGYTFYDGGDNKAETSLSGFKGNEELQILVLTWEGKTLVHINYKKKY